MRNTPQLSFKSNKGPCVCTCMLLILLSYPWSPEKPHFRFLFPSGGFLWQTKLTGSLRPFDIPQVKYTSSYEQTQNPDESQATVQTKQKVFWSWLIMTPIKCYSKYCGSLNAVSTQCKIRPQLDALTHQHSAFSLFHSSIWLKTLHATVSNSRETVLWRNCCFRALVPPIRQVCISTGQCERTFSVGHWHMPRQTA